MPNSFPPEAVDRYKKLKAMADNAAAAPNERGIAARKLGELEQEHPGIGVEATRPPESPHGAAWPDIAQWVDKAVDYAGKFMVGLESTMQRDRLLHRLIRVSSHVKRTGAVTLTVEIPASGIERLLRIMRDPVEAQMVAGWVSDQVSDEFLSIAKELREASP